MRTTYVFSEEDLKNMMNELICDIADCEDPYYRQWDDDINDLINRYYKEKKIKR